ncbi:MAG: hypothetical protein JXO49_03450 [Deltaproteobacteria bacterium]|nr:hypothetical protein [Candidatus Anaeroferrophillus wilburensis]MBN2888384.1 hypothetical protein [Deltaproteobacteria bacterium]
MAEDSLLKSGYFQVTPASASPATTLAERGRSKIVSRRLNSRGSRGKSSSILSRRELYQEIIRLLDQLSHHLREQGREINFTFLEVPGGYQLRAYDCSTNQQLCQLMSERFLHSPERLQKLVLEAISGMGTLFDASI